MNITIIVTSITTVIAIITLLINISQNRKNDSSRKAQFFKDIVDKIRFDQDLIEAMTILDYHGSWYDDTFPQSDTEVKMDKLLSYLSYCCYLYGERVISQAEFSLLEYKIKRACQNQNTQSYLKFLERFSLAHAIKKHSYYDLIQYMKKHVFNNDPKLIDEFDNDNNFAIARDYIELNLPIPENLKKNKK